MTTISNNDIARAIYLVSKENNESLPAPVLHAVVDFLFKKRLLSRAPDILSRLEKIINNEKGRIVARVSSVTKLQDKIKSELGQFLKKRYSAKEISFVETLDSKLVGGIKIEVNDEVIDLTIKNKIKKLQEYLTS
jgi:F-type H+-transporting ATPase subunit delta